MNTENLKTHVPDQILNQLPDVMLKFKINSVFRMSNFLGQCSHESSDFTVNTENLNYSADGLRKIFPSKFPGVLADSYARKPEMIASRVYSNRMGNGDESSKEGYKFRGRGFLQCTGKDNYSAFDLVVPENILDFPDLVAIKYSLLSAAWFWDKNALNVIADKGIDLNTITAITKKVNGGTNGLEDRVQKTDKFYNLLKDNQS